MTEPVLTVTLHPALDKTLELAAWQPGQVLRPTACHLGAGGKGLNVARVLAAFGVPVVAHAPLAGHAGAFVAEAVAAAGVQMKATWLPQGETRTCLTLLLPDGGPQPTEIHDPHPWVDEGSFQALRQAVRADLARGAAWLVLSGSLPPGLGPEAWEALLADAAEFGVPASLDTHGAGMAAVAKGPALIKPNAPEASAYLGQAPDPQAPEAALAALQALGAQAVLLSLGPDGAAYADATGAWACPAPEVQACNPVGSGDAMLAGFLAGRLQGLPLPEALALAVAAGSANAEAPRAAQVAPDRARTLAASLAPTALPTTHR